MFDPNQFINAAHDPMPTQFEVCPEGEYVFVLDSNPKMIVPRNIKGISAKGEPYDFWQMELTALCQDENVRKRLGRDRVPVRMRINLDIDDAGRLETGPNKNVSLGRLRDALNQNKPGWTPSALIGAGPFLGRVVHTEGRDGQTYAEIVRVARIS